MFINLKKTLTPLLVVFILSLCITACREEDDSTNPVQPVVDINDDVIEVVDDDVIEVIDAEVGTNVNIVSISPESANAGESTEFSIVVAYNLMGVSEGQINLGFSNGEDESFIINLESLIQEGQGEETFVVSAVPADFSVGYRAYVNITEYPRPASGIFSPIATDEVVIEVTP